MRVLIPLLAVILSARAAKAQTFDSVSACENVYKGAFYNALNKSESTFSENEVSSVKNFTWDNYKSRNETVKTNASAWFDMFSGEGNFSKEEFERIKGSLLNIMSSGSKSTGDFHLVSQYVVPEAMDRFNECMRIALQSLTSGGGLDWDPPAGDKTDILATLKYAKSPYTPSSNLGVKRVITSDNLELVTPTPAELEGSFLEPGTSKSFKFKRKDLTSGWIQVVGENFYHPPLLIQDATDPTSSFVKLGRTTIPVYFSQTHSGPSYGPSDKVRMWAEIQNTIVEDKGGYYLEQRIRAKHNAIGKPGGEPRFEGSFVVRNPKKLGDVSDSIVMLQNGEQALERFDIVRKYTDGSHSYSSKGSSSFAAFTAVATYKWHLNSAFMRVYLKPVTVVVERRPEN